MVPEGPWYQRGHGTTEGFGIFIKTAGGFCNDDVILQPLTLHSNIKLSQPIFNSEGYIFNFLCILFFK